ncbi:MAG: isopentenyl-diphosphate delta-isomerase, partial [Halobacteriovoraceae bacterium]|nr:isopentenyl-diphosphate delta-isomerase [Halobacteriovoraceae bacterium]
ACKDFGTGMGLGSCRHLLHDQARFDDFNIKPLMGDAPLYTNFGIAQIEQLLIDKKISRLNTVTQSLKADGIIFHVNPLQEWVQPEGDKYIRPAIETITQALPLMDYPVIVKEVGQGFGPNSLKSLMSMPLAAIELAGFGGTNFTILEQARLTGVNSSKSLLKNEFGMIGHDAQQMIEWLNELNLCDCSCKEVIISGGIQSGLQGHALMSQLKFSSIFGMASTLLQYAQGEYQVLYDYMEQLKESLLVANSFLGEKSE